MAGLQRLSLTGTPHERGVQHGEAFPDEIQHNLETYLDVFEAHGISTEQVRNRSAEFVPRIEDTNAAYAKEMTGVADGSDIPLEDIAMINIRYEVMYDSYTSNESAETNASESTIDGCTSYGI